MQFPTCEVYTRKQWQTARDKAKGKDGMSKQSMSKALDAFFSAIAKAEKKDSVDDANQAVAALLKVAKAYLQDVNELKTFTKVAEVINSSIINPLKVYEAKLTHLKPVDTSEQVKSAKEIGEEWKKAIGLYRQQLEKIKKEALVEVKRNLERVEAALEKPEQLTVKGVEEEVEGWLGKAADDLKKVRSEATDLYGKFDKWAYLQPRRNFGYLRDVLDLGDPVSQVYMDVAKAMKGQLSEVASAVVEIETLWKSDMIPQLDLQDRRVQTLRKRLAGEIDQASADNARIADEVREFVRRSAQVFIDLKVKSDVDWLQKASTGQIPTGDTIQYPSLALAFRKKLDSLPLLQAAIEKQHARIAKLVPKEQMAQFEKSSVGQDLEESLKTTVARMKQSKTLYEKLLELFAKQGYTA